ncbi:DUF4389 domain-containing protein [Dactylosporangium sp. NPDC051541]|uniref:DUF4389 domain-containing protein n=1 Tax=Dactylosporangium sp. NPDC051541 TaxID=3363977 RepID=UPI0037B27939
MGYQAVRVTAHPEPGSRWLWLVKWLLLMPHYLVLAVLWVAFAVLTLAAYVAVLFTGRYPRRIFGFNVGVLRWSWRVGYYGYWVLGTDRYPPFTLADVPDYPARLSIDGPPRPRRWLPLVAWLFALPHIALAAALTVGLGWSAGGQNGARIDRPGIAGLAVLVAGLALLFTGRYPRGLYDLLVGAWRWYLRVLAYVALLTDRYPPLRLDQGGDEPDGPLTPPAEEPAPRTPGRTALGAAALVVGVLGFLAGAGLTTGGAVLSNVRSGHEEGGYIVSDAVAVDSSTAAITVEDVQLRPGDAMGRVFVSVDAVRFTAHSSGDQPLFLGVARQGDLERWLRGTARDQFDGLYRAGDARYTRRGSDVTALPAAPTTQAFWLASISGNGTVTLDWTPAEGAFAVVLANADGSPGITAAVTAAARVPALHTVANSLVAGGIVTMVLAAALIVLGAVALGGGTHGVHDDQGPTGPPTASGPPAHPALPAAADRPVATTSSAA